MTSAWEQRELKYCLDLLKDGTHGTHKDAKFGVFLLSAKNIKNGRIDYDSNDRIISIEEYNEIHRSYRLKKGDVVLTIVGTIGEVAIIDDEKSYTFQRSVAILRPNKDLINLFLYVCLSTRNIQTQLQKKQSISAQPGVYLRDLSSIDFLFPTFNEQKKLGLFFQSFDQLITLHQRKDKNIKQ